LHRVYTNTGELNRSRVEKLIIVPNPMVVDPGEVAAGGGLHPLGQAAASSFIYKKRKGVSVSCTSASI
jgi:hypothetical protein